LGVNNLFDRRPPIIGGSSNTASGAGVNGNTLAGLYDPLGRMFFAAITARY